MPVATIVQAFSSEVAMAVGTVRARIGGDLFDVVRTGTVRHAQVPADTDRPPVLGRPEDVLAEHRSDGDTAILALPVANPEPASGRADADLFGAPPDARRGGFARRPGAAQGPGPARGPGHGGATRSPAPAPRPQAPGPATDRQLGFAGDISKALRIPMPEGRDVETISGFIALHRNRLKGNRGRP